MGEMSQPEEVKIDNQSQLMLWGMRDGEWERALTLRRAADLDENRQVFYRMENYLIPGGLVEEQDRENTDEMRRFRLTKRGTGLVEKRDEKLRMPTTREQVQKYALEGYEAGTSAKESVQTYRKKLHRLKRRVERAEEDVEAIEESDSQTTKRLQYLDERTQAVRGRSKRNKISVDDLRDEVDERETIRAVDDVRDDVSDIESRLSNVEARQAGLLRQQAHTERTRARLRQIAKPVGYVAVVAIVAAIAGLVAVWVLASDLFVSVASGAIAGVVGIAVGTGLAVWFRGALSGL